ncbi:Kinesin-like protein kif19 [Irineochytrium annulatum]|nr:Kinesin-like protein kif19 [Irineochytrium annulatum]
MNRTIHIVDPTDDCSDVLRQDRPKEKYYTFDQVFSDTASQHEVFDSTTRFLIPTVLKGFNATVFAYGATGAGKTYTMLGTDSHPGIMAATLAHLFREIGDSKDASSYEVTLSYLEIYNENIRDLLSGRSDFLDLREDGSHGVVVAGITTVVAKSAEEVLGNLRKGNRYRTQEATGANEVSSRSHAVLQVLVGHRMVTKDGHMTERFGKLSMIDLAGSERAADTKNRGMRMIEGANINRSLLALGNCINALGDTSKRAKYVNYRDSKLTRLLKDSLGGNCRTVMIANISPAASNFEETMNTLKYATRARAIKTKVSQQVIHKYDPVHHLQNEISTLKTRLASRSEATPDPSPTGIHPLNHSRMPSNASELARRSSTNHPPGVPSAAATRDDSAVFAQTQADLETLFTEQFEARERIVDAEEAAATLDGAVARKRAELVVIERRVREGGINMRESEAAAGKCRAALEKLDLDRKKHERVKEKEGRVVAELEERIQNFQQALPRTLELRSRQYLELLVRNHFTEMDSLDLNLNFTLSTNALEQKEHELDSARRHLQLLENINNVQRDLMKRSDVKPSDLLTSLMTDLARLVASKTGFLSRDEAEGIGVGAARLRSLNERINGAAGNGTAAGRQRRATVTGIVSSTPASAAGAQQDGKRQHRHHHHHHHRHASEGGARQATAIDEEVEEDEEDDGAEVAEEDADATSRNGTETEDMDGNRHQHKHRHHHHHHHHHGNRSGDDSEDGRRSRQRSSSMAVPRGTNADSAEERHSRSDRRSSTGQHPGSAGSLTNLAPVPPINSTAPLPRRNPIADQLRRTNTSISNPSQPIRNPPPPKPRTPPRRVESEATTIREARAEIQRGIREARAERQLARSRAADSPPAEPPRGRPPARVQPLPVAEGGVIAQAQARQRHRREGSLGVMHDDAPPKVEEETVLPLVQKRGAPGQVQIVYLLSDVRF